VVPSAASYVMKQCLPEQLNSERRNVTSISFSCNLAANWHYRADISCQGKCSLISPRQTVPNSLLLLLDQTSKPSCLPAWIYCSGHTSLLSAVMDWNNGTHFWYF